LFTVRVNRNKTAVVTAPHNTIGLGGVNVTVGLDVFIFPAETVKPRACFVSPTSVKS